MAKLMWAASSCLRARANCRSLLTQCATVQSGAGVRNTRTKPYQMNLPPLRRDLRVSDRHTAVAVQFDLAVGLEPGQPGETHGPS